MKIFTLGNGFVGNHLPYPIIPDRIFPDQQQIKNLLIKHKPDVIINCIGYCGVKNIDDCEINKEKTILSNLIIPSMLAEECNKLNINLIHISSGCIFYGQSPSENGWKETNSPTLTNASYYSKIKYACELAISDFGNITVLRIRMPVSSKNDPRNFINKVRNYSQVIDIPNSMTLMDDLVRCVDWAAKENKTGIYHVTNAQPITAAQVMREFQKYQPLHKFEVIDEGELDKLTLAKRSNCLLNTDKLRESGFTMSPSEDGLKACMAAYIKNI